MSNFSSFCVITIFSKTLPCILPLSPIQNLPTTRQIFFFFWEDHTYFPNNNCPEENIWKNIVNLRNNLLDFLWCFSLNSVNEISNYSRHNTFISPKPSSDTFHRTDNIYPSNENSTQTSSPNYKWETLSEHSPPPLTWHMPFLNYFHVYKTKIYFGIIKLYICPPP